MLSCRWLADYHTILCGRLLLISNQPFCLLFRDWWNFKMVSHLFSICRTNKNVCLSSMHVSMLIMTTLDHTLNWATRCRARFGKHPFCSAVSKQCWHERPIKRWPLHALFACTWSQYVNGTQNPLGQEVVAYIVAPNSIKRRWPSSTLEHALGKKIMLTFCPCLSVCTHALNVRRSLCKVACTRTRHVCTHANTRQPSNGFRNQARVIVDQLHRGPYRSPSNRWARPQCVNSKPFYWKSSRTRTRCSNTNHGNLCDTRHECGMNLQSIIFWYTCTHMHTAVQIMWTITCTMICALLSVSLHMQF